MTVPYYPWTVWIWAGFDPALIVVALYLGWTASQFGKVFIAAIAALGFSVLFSYAVSAAGIPWPAPVTHDGPTFFRSGPWRLCCGRSSATARGRRSDAALDLFALRPVSDRTILTPVATSS